MYGGIHNTLDVMFVVSHLGNPQHTQFHTAPFRAGGRYPMSFAKLEMQFHEAGRNRPLLSHFLL